MTQHLTIGLCSIVFVGQPEFGAGFTAYLLLVTLDGMQMEGCQQSESVIALAREMLSYKA